VEGNSIGRMEPERWGCMRQRTVKLRRPDMNGVLAPSPSEGMMI